MEPSLRVFASLSHKKMEGDVQIDLMSKGLNGGHNTRRKLCARCYLGVFEQVIDNRPGKFSEKPALVFEEDAQHLGDGKDLLAMRHIEKEIFPHPFAPLLKALGMSGGTEPSRATGEHQKMLRLAVRTADACRPALWVAALEITLNDFFDDPAQVALLLLEAGFIFLKKLVKVMEKHSGDMVRSGCRGTIDSCHSRVS